MDISVQLYTGSCTKPAELDQRGILHKLNRILRRTDIKNAIIGWNKDVDLSEIVFFLKHKGVPLYLWLPVFSELDELSLFLPLIGLDNRKIEINFNMGNNEKFQFCCPANPENIERIIGIYEKHYYKEIYDGVFLDKIRFPSFLGGMNSVSGCFCSYCRSNYSLPGKAELQITNSMYPFGIMSYNNLSYDLNDSYKKLFDYKCDAIFHSLEWLCKYFREKDLKIGFDLFAPFLAYFVGQDYFRLMSLADFVKPMFYSLTNAPAGLLFEVNMYAKAFDGSTENARKRKELFLDCIDYGTDFVKKEIAGIRKIIENKGLKTRLYAGIEINYLENIAPVTEGYIRESIAKIREADGVVASWDLNTMSDNNIDCLLDAIGA